MYADIVKRFSSVYDKITGRRFSLCRDILERTQWLEKKDLKAFQLRKVKALLRHAYENVPYYHKIFRNVCFKPDSLNSLGDMKKIPILSRSTLRLKGEELIAKNIEKKQMIACRTTGTTAIPLRFYMSKTEMPWHVAAELRGYTWGGYRPGDKLVHIRRIRPGEVFTRPLERLRYKVLRYKFLSNLNLSEEALFSFSQTMQSFRPDYVLGATGSLNILSTFLLENDEYRINPKAIFTYGQQLYPHHRKSIESAFNCKVYDRYGSTEVLQIASECKKHKGHHIAEENVLVEIEKNGEVAALGEEGKVLVTSLNNYAMPFIRYELGDMGKMLKDDCPCGRKIGLLSPIGRAYEYFVHSDGTFTMFRDLQTVFEDLPVKNFQIVQEKNDDIVIKVIPKGGFNQAHINFILKNIIWIVADIAHVRVEIVNSLPITGFGKVNNFVSKVKTKYT